MMEAKEPLAKEKLTTPINIMIEEKTISSKLVADISPYPTVVMVVIVQ